MCFKALDMSINHHIKPFAYHNLSLQQSINIMPYASFCLQHTKVLILKDQHDDGSIEVYIGKSIGLHGCTHLLIIGGELTPWGCKEIVPPTNASQTNRCFCCLQIVRSIGIITCLYAHFLPWNL